MLKEGISYTEAIKVALSGEVQGFERLYDLSKSAVLSTIYSKLSSTEKHIGEDIFQDTYMTAFQKLESIKEPEKFQSWITTIARNKCLDYFRRTKNVNFGDLENDDSENSYIDDVLLVDDIQPGPSVVADREEISEIMAIILDSIPDAQRICLSLNYLDGLSASEISEELGMNINTVKSNLRYGKIAVEKEVENYHSKGYKLFSVSPLALLIYYQKNLGLFITDVPEFTFTDKSYVSSKVAHSEVERISLKQKISNLSPIGRVMATSLTAVAVVVTGITTTHLLNSKVEDRTPVVPPVSELVPEVIPEVKDEEEGKNYEIILNDIEGETFIDYLEKQNIIITTKGTKTRVYSRDGSMIEIEGVAKSYWYVDWFGGTEEPANLSDYDGYFGLYMGDESIQAVGFKDNANVLEPLGPGDAPIMGGEVGNYKVILYNRADDLFYEFSGDPSYRVKLEILESINFPENPTPVYEISDLEMGSTESNIYFTGKMGILSNSIGEGWNPDERLIFDTVAQKNKHDDVGEFLPVILDGKLGLVDNKGEIVVDPQYDLPNKEEIVVGHFYETEHNVPYSMRAESSTYPHKYNIHGNNELFPYKYDLGNYNLNQKTMGYIPVGRNEKTILINQDNKIIDGGWDKILIMSNESFIVFKDGGFSTIKVN